MPGLRLGFMHIPEGLWNKVLSAKHTTDISTSGLIQRTFDLYLREGLWIKHIGDMRKIYKKRYEIFMEALRDNFPKDIHYKDPGGGLHIWFHLPGGLSDRELYARCLKKNVLITPGSLFFAGSERDDHFRMSFASVNPAEIKKGIKIVGKTLRERLKKEKPTPSTEGGYSPFM